MTTEITNCNTIAIKEQWFVSLIEDLADIITETEFTSRWALVEGYHSLGKRILEEYNNFQRVRMADASLVHSIAESLGKRPRTIYYAVQFAKSYPDLNLLPEGKNTSWSHIINKYLTDGTDGKEKTVKKADLYRENACLRLMIIEIKELLNLELQKEPANNGEINKIEFIRYLQDQVNRIINKA